MLEIIRQNAASWLMKFILGPIVVVFIFWGVGTFRSERLDVLAKVNGEKILVEEYRKAYNMYLENLKRIYGGSIPDIVFEKMDVKKQVLNQLIDNLIIRQKANDIGLMVTDKELQQAILSIPAFKSEGVFDRRLYELALRRASMTPADFEDQLRQQILTKKLMSLITAGVYSPDKEALDYFRYENAQLNIAYVKIDASSCVNDVNATDERLKKWFETHKEEFKTDPQIQLRYLLFAQKDFEKAANVTDEDIKSYYEEHKEAYKVPEERKASHILIKVPQDANATVVEAAKKRILDIKKQLDKGAKFEELAKKYSEDEGTKEKGGELGFFRRGAMVKPFDEKVFSMQKGEISEPVRTAFGWHIIRLEDVKKEHYKSLEEVKDEIRRLLVAQKAKRLMWEAANKAYDTIIEMGSLDSYAKAENKKLKESGLFSRKEPAPFLGHNPSVLDMIFSLQKGELSSLLEVPNGIIIAEVIDKKPPYVPAFEKVKDRVKEAFIDQESLNLCEQKAKDILAKAKAKGLTEAAKEYGLKVEKTGFYNRQDPTAKGKLPFDVGSTALSLSENKPFPANPIVAGRSFYIIHLEGFKVDADQNRFEQEKKALKGKLRLQKARSVFEKWLKHQRENAKIELYKKL